MVSITKSKKEPASLAEFRLEVKKKNHVISGKDYLVFRDLPVFKELQIALLKEQKYICCYCMGKINESTIVVEHFKCREKYGDLSLTYSNMLGSCKGCTNNSNHCDKSKKNKALLKLPNPAECQISQWITYSTSGEIRTKEGILKTEIEKTDLLIDINKTLNLNNEDLKKARTDAALSFINKFNNSKKLPKINKQYLPFWGFTEFLLRKKI